MRSGKHQGISLFHRYCWCGLLLLTALSARAEINGAAIYRHHGQEQYLALLHLPEVTTSAEAALRQSSVTGTEMEFVVLAPSITSRRLSRHWAESVVINADRSVIEANIDGLSQLSDLLRGELKYGDKLTLSARLGGVDVALNRVPLGSLAFPDLLQVMLHIWLGPVPPSSAFRAALLSAGSTDDALLSRYLTTVAASQRRAEIEQQWLAPASAVTATETTPDTAAAVTASDSPAPDAGRAASVPPAERQLVVETRVETVANVAEASTVEPPTLLASATPASGLSLSLSLAPTSEQLAEPETVPAAVQSLGQDVVAPSELAVAQPAAGVLATPQDDIATSPPPDQGQALLASKRYYDDIKKRVFGQVSYPTVALRNGRESEVGLQLQIDADGELLAVDVSEGSRYKYFNKAAVKAVRAASPFGAPPQGLTENGVYQIKMQVNFRINGG